MVSLLGYGYSTSYLGAILGRFMPSLFVGSPVALKAAMGDVCDQEGQAKVMAMFILGHGIGSVMGKHSSQPSSPNLHPPPSSSSYSFLPCPHPDPIPILDDSEGESKGSQTLRKFIAYCKMLSVFSA